MSNRSKGDLGRMIGTNLERIMPQSVIFVVAVFVSLFCRLLEKAGTESFKPEAGPTGPVFSGRDVLYAD